jgi:hypothetical protein
MVSTSNKVKALLSLADKDKEGLAAYLGIANQSMRNKFNRNSFSADDLIRTAEFCGAELSFKLKKKQMVILSAEDLKDLPSRNRLTPKRH